MIVGTCEFAEDVVYDVENGVWVRMTGSVATVGVVSYMAWLTGRVVSVSYNDSVSRVLRGQVIGSYEGPKHFAVVKSPISGTLKAYNAALKSSPKLLQEKPYSEGWFAQIEADMSESAENLLGLEQATPLFEAKIKALRARCYGAVPDTELVLLGAECSAVLVQLNELLANAPLGTVVHVVTDEPTADIEMLRWSKQTGQILLEKRVEDGIHHFIVKKAR